MTMVFFKHFCFNGVVLLVDWIHHEKLFLLFQVSQTLDITINPVDDSLPIVQSLGMTVQEGLRKTITEFELKATDADTEVRQDSPLPPPSRLLLRIWAIRKMGLCSKRKIIGSVISPCDHTLSDHNIKQTACRRSSLHINRWMRVWCLSKAKPWLKSSGMSLGHISNKPAQGTFRSCDHSWSLPCTAFSVNIVNVNRAYT